MIGISTKTIYAVSALQILGQIPKNEVLKIKMIASKASIPQNFLEQILLSLKKQGLLHSVKGANGGYRLAKGLDEISLKEVAEILESDIFADIYPLSNPALTLFWADFKTEITKVFEKPLSELKSYELLANESLNYSI
jgi:Rrf2 family protein